MAQLKAMAQQQHTHAEAARDRRLGGQIHPWESTLTTMDDITSSQNYGGVTNYPSRGNTVNFTASSLSNR